jgi:hypothetical protein
MRPIADLIRNEGHREASGGVGDAPWALGDFDYNGFVNDDDVTLLGVFYNPSAPPLNSPAAPGANAVAAVPEPSTLALLGATVAALTFAGLRRRLRLGVR